AGQSGGRDRPARARDSSQATQGQGQVWQRRPARNEPAEPSRAVGHGSCEGEPAPETARRSKAGDRGPQPPQAIPASSLRSLSRQRASILQELADYPLQLRIISKRPPRTATRYFWDNTDDRHNGPSGGIHVGGAAATVFFPANPR